MSSDSNLSVAVIIPCFNDAQFLPRALTSVIAQTSSAQQVIVVDDGSTDTTQLICQQFDPDRTWLHYIYQENAGVSSARNNGLAHAQTEYVIFLDADDELMPDAIAQYQLVIQAHSPAELHWLIGASESIRDERTRKRSISIPKNSQRAFAGYVKKQLHLGNISNMCFKRSAVAALEFPEALKFSEDFVLFALLLSRYRPTTVKQIVAREHRRENSLRSTVNLQTLLANDVEHALFDSPHLPQDYRSYRSAYIARFAHSVTKQAYRERAYSSAAQWYSIMIQHEPQRLLNLKLLLRYLRSRLMAGRDLLQQGHKHRPNLH